MLPRHSVWLLTINSNKLLPNPQARADFDRAIDEVINDIFFYLGTKNEEDRAPDTDLPDPRLVLSIEHEEANEVGGKFRRYHLHAVIQIKHKTKLFIHYNALADAISEKVGYAVNLDGRAGKNFQRELQEYINKNQLTFAQTKFAPIPTKVNAAQSLQGNLRSRSGADISAETRPDVPIRQRKVRRQHDLLGRDDRARAELGFQRHRGPPAQPDGAPQVERAEVGRVAPRPARKEGTVGRAGQGAKSAREVAPGTRGRMSGLRLRP